MKEDKILLSSFFNYAMPVYQRLRLMSLFAFLVTSACIISCKKPVEEDLSDYTHIDPATLSKGDTILPFKFLHPGVGAWKVEIRISGDDLHDVSHKIKTRKFTSTDEEMLKRFRGLRFIYGVGRTQRASSTLRIYDDLRLYEQHGVVFEKNHLSLQSARYGIMTCADYEEFFRILDEMN